MVRTQSNYPDSASSSSRSKYGGNREDKDIPLSVSRPLTCAYIILGRSIFDTFFILSHTLNTNWSLYSITRF